MAQTWSVHVPAPTLLSVFVVAFTLGLGFLAQASDADRANATKAEQDAFKHVKNKDWCKATNAFLDAYEYSPEVLYIYNAAKAAELAEDRKLALQLSLEMMGQFRARTNRQKSIRSFKNCPGNLPPSVQEPPAQEKRQTRTTMRRKRLP